MADPHTSSPENNKETGAEDAEKGAANTKPAQNEIQSGVILSVNERQEGDIVALPTAYEIESGLSSGSATIEKYVKASLLMLEPSMTRPNFNIHDEVAKVWKIILLPNFFTTRRGLHQHLENREKMPGEKLQARTNWDISDPSDILDTLDNVRRNTVDNKIHRAYGQTMLFSSVNGQVAKGYKSTVTGHRSDHTALLEELARKKAGPVSQTEIDQIIAGYFYDYYAGRNWLAVIDWFGGSGVVLVFVIAGILIHSFSRQSRGGISDISQGLEAGTWRLGGPNSREVVYSILRVSLAALGDWLGHLGLTPLETTASMDLGQ